jgi:UDP-glucuronate 4-epimerase
MKIVVTGVAGFIGSHLAIKLIKAGHEVIGIDNLNDYYSKELKNHNLELISQADSNSNFMFEFGDIRDASFLENCGKKNQFNQDTTLVHLAAMAGVRPSIQNPSLYVDVNVVGTQNLFELCRKFGMTKVVYASSSSVYGESKTVPFSEEQSVDNPISPYAATKKSNELMAHTYFHLFNMTMIGLRFFTVYGARQRPDLAIHKFARMISTGEAIPFYGDGSTRRDYTFIDDIIDGVVKSIDYAQSSSPICDVLNLGESKTTTLTELVTLLEEKLKKKAIINRLPMQAGDVSRTYADITKAVNLIGYQPQTLINEGLDTFVDWYNEYYQE